MGSHRSSRLSPPGRSRTRLEERLSREVEGDLGSFSEGVEGEEMEEVGEGCSGRLDCGE